MDDDDNEPQGLDDDARWQRLIFLCCNVLTEGLRYVVHDTVHESWAVHHRRDPSFMDMDGRLIDRYHAWTLIPRLVVFHVQCNHSRSALHTVAASYVRLEQAIVDILIERRTCPSAVHFDCYVEYDAASKMFLLGIDMFPIDYVQAIKGS